MALATGVLYIPSSGWTLARVDDLWEATHDCDYCHNEHIRYVHTLTRPNYPPLRVGCVYAEKLTGGGAVPREREKLLRNRAARFANWVNSYWDIQPDSQTRTGREFHWEYTYTAYQASDGWRWKVRIPIGVYNSNNAFRTADEAKRQFWLRHIEKVDEEPPNVM